LTRNFSLRACSKSGILALQTPKFYLAGSKRARKSGFLRLIDRKNPQFEQALSVIRPRLTQGEAASPEDWLCAAFTRSNRLTVSRTDSGFPVMKQ
jgi:hypothetical protein